jgi:histidine triad (HIT) family protein
MNSIFSRIIRNEIPSFKILENDTCIAILARGQVQEGHTLIIPKKEIDKYTDMEEQRYLELQEFCLKVAKILKKAYPNKERIIQNIVGFEVPHVHIHLIPSNSIIEGLRTEEKVYDDNKMNEILEHIKKYI